MPTARAAARTRSRRGQKAGSRRSTKFDQQRAKRNAEFAREIAEARRAEHEGVAGWIAERAGDWSLDDWDPKAFERQKYFWNPLVEYWFRMEVSGWENIPEPPTLLIGIHSGAPFVWDAWTLGIHWWRHFGPDRPVHGTAHDALMAAPGVGDFFRSMGVLPAAPDSIAAALAAKHDVALWPGGEVDSLRPWTERDKAILGGRLGFVKMAIRAGVPIVPVSTVGGADAMPVLTSGRRLAGLLRVDRLLKIKRFPIALSVPWGLAPAVLPDIPLPTKIRTAFQEPVDLGGDADLADDEDFVKEKYEEVRQSIQHGMDALARHRRLPLFG
jgi:1-acyl-sn-glycerol-3-phosphate acyltransferase